MGDTSRTPKGKKKKVKNFFSSSSLLARDIDRGYCSLLRTQLISDGSIFCLCPTTLLSSLTASGLAFPLQLVPRHLTIPGWLPPLTSPYRHFTKIHFIKIKFFTMLVADGIIKNFKEINYNIGILSVVRVGI